MDQATSLSLISSSQEQCHGNTVGTLFTAIADRENKAPGPNTAESSPSLISHSQDYGLRVTENLFGLGILLRFICVQPRMGQYHIEGWSRKLM